MQPVWTIARRSGLSHTWATEHEVLHRPTTVRPRRRRHGGRRRGGLGRHRPRSARSRRADRDKLWDRRPDPAHARPDHPHLRARVRSPTRVWAVPALAFAEHPPALFSTCGLFSSRASRNTGLRLFDQRHSQRRQQVPSVQQSGQDEAPLPGARHEAHAVRLRGRMGHSGNREMSSTRVGPVRSS